MTSRFGWLDHDDAQRAPMKEVVKLFQDKGSVDELGIGSIRDAFSNSLLPGHVGAAHAGSLPAVRPVAPAERGSQRGHTLDQARSRAAPARGTADPRPSSPAASRPA